MTLSNTGQSSPNDPAPCEVLPQCAICDGRMETVYERAHQKVCQCVECATTLTVPVTAWTIAAERRRSTPAA